MSKQITIVYVLQQQYYGNNQRGTTIWSREDVIISVD